MDGLCGQTASGPTVQFAWFYDSDRAVRGSTDSHPSGLPQISCLNAPTMVYLWSRQLVRHVSVSQLAGLCWRLESLHLSNVYPADDFTWCCICVHRSGGQSVFYILACCMSTRLGECLDCCLRVCAWRYLPKRAYRLVCCYNRSIV